jgi:uncharacterized protein (DUF58 family)
MTIGTGTAGSAQRFSPEELARIQDLELKARCMVEGFLSGLHESPFHGLSVEFSEYRNYQAGDDLRCLDWRVFARTNRLCVKQFEAETNCHFYVLCDTSDSMGYQGRQAAWSKLDCAKTVASALTWLMIKQNDAVGMLTLGDTDQDREFIRPSQKPSQLGLMLSHLERLRAVGTVELPALLEFAARLVRRRSVILLLSDLLEPAEALTSGLNELRFHGHDVMVFQILDRDEMEFPFDRSAVFEDMETGDRRHVTPAATRERYLERFNAFMRAHREQLRSLEMPQCVLCTDDDPLQALAAFLLRRKMFR